jgi:hypothetical protein
VAPGEAAAAAAASSSEELIGEQRHETLKVKSGTENSVPLFYKGTSAWGRESNLREDPMRFMLLLAGLTLVGVASAERINHAGRILGPLLPINESVLFNTPQADFVVSSMQILPRDNAWNEDISGYSPLANSASMIAMINSELSSSRRQLRGFFEMNFVLIPDGQPLVPIDLFLYADESDPSPYPIPWNLPVEGWPRETGTLTLDEWQRDLNLNGGDRHSIMVQPGTGGVWETWQTRKLVDQSWEAANGAKFNFNTNAQRPLGWTSGDAAGLSMFAGIARFDETERGQIEHALRIVVKHTRGEYIYPASHVASDPFTTDPNVPAMGQRLQLLPSFTVPSNWTIEEKAVCAALKKYGAIVADNGNFFQISIAPDQRWPDGCFDHLLQIPVTQFRAMQTTGPTGGPRAANPPLANAGPDLTAQIGVAVNLSGSTSGGTGAVTKLWTKYSGPGTVSFANSASAATTATFSANGTYVVMLKASDATHTPGYDAAIVKVGTGTMVSGTLALRDLSSPTGFPGSVTFEYRLPWTATVSYSTVGNLGAGGSFTIPAPPVPGSYDLAVKVTHWLRQKRLVNTAPGNVSGLAFSLNNGDVDGDNEVTISDYSVMSLHINGTGVGDLNEDGTVDIGDFAILSANFGLIGD